MGYNATGHKAFEASAAIAQYARVVLASDGTVSTAGATDKDIGVATRQAFASGDVVDIQLHSAAGTHYAIAGEALAAGAEIYGAASGKVADTQATGSFVRGIALEAATADGDVIEILPYLGETAGS